MRSLAAQKLAARFQPWWAVALLVVVPLFASLPALGGWFASNPIYTTSGLGYNALAGILPGQPGWLDPNAGWTAQALGRLAARDWLRGSIPLWNPFSGIGLPLAANAQAGALFVPFVLLYFFADGVLLVRIALQIVAGLATYALLRQLRLGRFPSALGAGIFELCGAFAWFAAADIRPIAFLPVTLLGIEYCRGARGGRALAGWTVIALGLAFSLYAGFPEVAYIDGLLAVVWTIYRAATDRTRTLPFLGMVAGGAVTGVLLAAPVLVPFIQYLQLAVIEGHSAALGTVGLPADSFPMLLFPYIFGSLAGLVGSDPSALFVIWGHIGGYVGFATLLLAVLALRRRGHEVGLRWLLATWIVVCIAKSWNLQPVAFLVNQVPLVDRIEFFRYATASWELAAAMLAAFAAEDWRLGARRSPIALWASLAGVVLLGGLSLGLGKDVIQVLYHNDYTTYLPYLVGSLGLAGGAAFIVVYAYLGPPNRWQQTLLAGGALGASVVLFMLPLFSGQRQPQLDTAPVRYLSQHLGMSRFYTVGPLAPNYGAYYSIASINYVSLPVVSRWADIVSQQLDPKSDPSYFIPSVRLSLSEPSAYQQISTLAGHLRAFETLGVKYVLAPPFEDPFAPAIRPAVSGDTLPEGLAPGQRLSGVVPASEVTRKGALTHFFVRLGTGSGQANGSLRATVCQQGRCASGAVPLATAIDNSYADVPLAKSLPISAHQPLTFQIGHAGGGQTVYVWLGPVATPAQAQKLKGPTPSLGGMAADLVLRLSARPNSPRLVYHDPLVDIYRLDHPSSYFHTSQPGACHLQARGRTEVVASCATTARLVRIELDYPGWSATVDNHSAPIRRIGYDEQSVALPAGRSVVRFGYQPVNMLWAYAALALGLLVLLGGAIRLSGIDRLVGRKHQTGPHVDAGQGQPPA